MRTKLLLSAAILAAGVAASQAQNVYSVNVVGYVNIPVTNNSYYLLGNPLTASPNNAVTNVLPIQNGDFDSSTVFLFKGGKIQAAETYNGLTQTSGYWYPGTNIINPGTGFFFYAQIGAISGITTNTITFAGTVVTNATVSLPVGYSLVSSPFPASTNLQSLGLGLPWAQDSDVLIRYNAPGGNGHPGGAYLNDQVTYGGGYGWIDGNVVGGGSTNGPSLNVAEGFYYYNASGDNGDPTVYSWVQSFYVQ